MYCPTNIFYCHNLPSLQAELVQGQLLFECEMSLTEFYGGKNKRESADWITYYDRIIELLVKYFTVLSKTSNGF